MTEEETRKIYEDYYAALMAKPFDLEKVVSFWADDIYYEDMAFEYICRNKAETRDFFIKSWAVWSSNILEITWFLVNKNRLACEWIWIIEDTGTKIHGVSIQELNAEGKIKWGRDYYDLFHKFQIAQQSGLSADAFWKKLKL